MDHRPTPDQRRNRMVLGLVAVPVAGLAVVAALAGDRVDIAIVFAALGIAAAGAGVEAAATGSRLQGSGRHRGLLWVLAVVSLAVGLAPWLVAPDLDGRRGTAVLVLGPIAGVAVAWSLARRAMSMGD